MPTSTRTRISTLHLKQLEIFAEENNLPSMRFGTYNMLEDTGYMHNKICYCMIDPDETETENLLLITLKFGSFEKAFDEYRKFYDSFRKRMGY